MKLKKNKNTKTKTKQKGVINVQDWTETTPPQREGEKPMGMCRWMGSHFYDWIDYNGVAHFWNFEVRKFFIFSVSKRTRMFVL